jgi:hypothetical protein
MGYFWETGFGSEKFFGEVYQRGLEGYALDIK